MSDGDDGGEPGTPADLRFTRQEGKQVRVERDLSGGGHLARGDHTRMSRLNFTARARPANPGERDVAAFDGRAAGAAPTDPAPPPGPLAADPGAADPNPVDASAEQGSADASIKDRIGRLFGL